MAKITITFEFDSHEDAEEMEMLMKYKDYYDAIDAFKDYLRDKNKYKMSDNISMESIYTAFIECLKYYNIKL